MSCILCNEDKSLQMCLLEARDLKTVSVPKGPKKQFNHQQTRTLCLSLRKKQSILFIVTKMWWCQVVIRTSDLSRSYFISKIYSLKYRKLQTHTEKTFTSVFPTEERLSVEILILRKYILFKVQTVLVILHVKMSFLWVGYSLVSKDVNN